jgi:hypothetical protein
VCGHDHDDLWRGLPHGLGRRHGTFVLCNVPPSVVMLDVGDDCDCIGSFVGPLFVVQVPIFADMSAADDMYHGQVDTIKQYLISRNIPTGARFNCKRRKTALMNVLTIFARQVSLTID